MEELKLEKDIFNISELLFENTSEQSVEGEIELPDYCHDIKKILKCISTPFLVSSQFLGDRISVDGNVHTEIIYCDDENNICGYDKMFPFSKSVQTDKQIDQSSIEILLNTAYSNCRPISPRRIDYHSSIAVTAKSLGRKEENVIYNAENNGVQLSKNFSDLCEFVGCSVKLLFLEENIKLDEKVSSVNQILRSCETVEITETKTVNNKILLKGDLKLYILYLDDSSPSVIQKYETSLPISQILELNGLDNDCINNIDVRIVNKEIIPNNTKKEIDFKFTLQANLKSYKKCEKTLSADCYSTMYDVEFDKKYLSFDIPVESNNQIELLKQKENYSNGITRVMDFWTDEPVISCKKEDNSIKIIGTINICLLGTDKDNQPFYSERPVSFEKDIDMDKNDCYLSVNGFVSGMNYNLLTDNVIEFRIEINMLLNTFKKISEQIVTDIRILNENSNKNSALTVYFSNEDESVWDVAKKYRTTVNAISAENDIKGDKLPSSCPILIPSC